jgi:hypothetical protein
MRRFLATVLLGAALLGGAMSLSGCIVVPPPRPYHQRVWIAGYWAPQHVWVAGHWGYR